MLQESDSLLQAKPINSYRTEIHALAPGQSVIRQKPFSLFRPPEEEACRDHDKT